jgi:hypothetical protein
MRKVSRVLLVTVVAAALAGIPGAHAQAETCAAGKVCIYSENDFSGIKLVIPGTLGVSNKLGHSALEDHVNSAMNGTNHAVGIFDELNAQTLIVCLNPAQIITNFSAAALTPDGSSTKVFKRRAC